MTVGTLVAFLGYIGGLFGPVQGLTNTYQTFGRPRVSLEAIFSILDAEMWWPTARAPRMSGHSRERWSSAR